MGILGFDLGKEKGMVEEDDDEGGGGWFFFSFICKYNIFSIN